MIPGYMTFKLLANLCSTCMAGDQMALQYRRGSKQPVGELNEHGSLRRKVHNLGLRSIENCKTHL